jgi:hypothetical protein
MAQWTQGVKGNGKRCEPVKYHPFVLVHMQPASNKKKLTQSS